MRYTHHGRQMCRGECQVSDSDWVWLTLIWDIPHLANLLSHFCQLPSAQAELGEGGTGQIKVNPTQSLT